MKDRQAAYSNSSRNVIIRYSLTSYITTVILEKQINLSIIPRQKVNSSLTASFSSQSHQTFHFLAKKF